MVYNLDIAIALYEEEKLALENKIKNCLEDFEEPDYYLAHYHQEALYQIRNTLRILYSFKGDVFLEKQFSLSKILRLEKELKKSDLIIPKELLEEYLEKEKKYIEKIELAPKVIEPDIKETILDIALADLIDNKIKKFRLVFNKSANVSLFFSRSNKSIRIAFSDIRNHLKNNIFDESQIQYLENQGFAYINKNKLEASIKIHDDQTYRNIRFLLAQVVFKMLLHAGDDENAYIQF
ncbi:hypothetical protein [Ferruginibacter sp. SUN106]|uniref:hypothetical protein n=1 Tax=Ferruginibacter sp. SUN106 TaxID=2978348 RepID=UPI003D363FC7